ncbi:hypothetical protein SprV_0902770800 [Sparganum proliferum]
MAKVSILAILGYNGKERNEDKFQKLLCEGLVTALGNLAPEVDAALATASSPSPSPQKTEEYGTSVTQTLSSGCHVRVLLQPKIAQFQAAFNEAVQTAVQAGPGSTIAVVYAGQVLHSTGEWILADSTFSGSQLKMWVDCEATVSWQPEIPKLMAPPTGVPPYHLCVCTPSAGARTCWPTTAKLQAAGDASQGSTYVMLSKSRKITVQLQVKASWRLDGKLVSLPQAGSDYEGLNALSKEMAALQWSQHETEGLNYEEVALLQKTFKPSPPALYLMPSGPGGVQSQAAGIFVIEGTNVLLGSAFAHGHPPQWWDLAKNLDRLDAVVLPDWSAASIQSYNFLAHFANTASVSTGYAWIGSIMVPPTDNSSGESVLVMSPSTSAGFGDRQFTLPAGPTATSADRLPDRLRIFSKLGLGELYLQPLGAHVGTLVIWKPTKAAPIRLLLPAVAGVLHPVQSLSHVLKALRRVPEVCLEAKTAASVSGGSTPRPATSVLHNSSSTAAPTKTAAKPLASSRLSSALNHTTPRSTPASARTRTTTTATPTTTPGKTVNGTKKSPTSSGTPASAAATTKKPAAAAATTTQVRSAPPAATRTIVKTATTTTAKAAPTPAPAKTTSRPSNGHARPSAAAAAAGTASAKASPRSTTEKTSAVKIGTKKTPVAPKTEARLNAHAARVQAKSKPSTPASTGDAPATTATTRSSPSDTVLKFAADGRPTNLPPRRKIGEKTVMEELAELPTTESKSSAAESPLLSPAAEAEQTKSPETSSSAEVVSPARHEPDSLLSPAEEASAGVRSPHASANLNGEIEPNDVIGQKQHEEADLHPEEAHLEKDISRLAEPEHAAHPEDALQHEEESLESHEAHGHAILDDLTSGYRVEEEQHQHMVHSPEAFEHPDDHVIPHEMQRDFAAIPAQHDEAYLHSEEAHLEKDLTGWTETEHAVHPADSFQHAEDSLESHETHHGFLEPSGHAIPDDLTRGYRAEEDQHQLMAHSPEAFEHPDDHIIPHETEGTFVRRDLQEEADFEAEAARHFADVAGRHYDKEHQHKIQTPAPPVHEDDHATLHEAAPDLAAGSADHETSGGWGYVGDHATHVHGHLEEESRLQAQPAVVGVAPQESIGELTGDIGHYSADPAYAADHPGTAFEGAGDPTVLSHEKTAYEATYQPSSTYTFEGGDLDQAHQHYYHGDVDAFGQVKAEAESSQWAAEDEESRQYYQQHHLNAGSLGKNEDEQLMSTETTRLLDPSMPPLHMENQFPVHSGLTDLQEEDYREHQQGGEEGYSPALGGGVTSTTSGAEFPYPSDPNALMPDGQPHQSFLEDSAAAAAAVVADGQYVADSTTGTTAAATPDRPLVGLSPLGQVVTQEENQHSGSVEPPEDLSPTSDGSHDSVVHHDPTIIGSPEAYGFKLDVVTSSSAAAAATVTPAEAGASPDAADLSPNSAVPHPLAYRPHDLPTTTTAAGVAQEFAVPDGVSPASYNSDISSPAGIPTHHFGAAGGVLYETQRSNGYSHHEGDTNGQLESTTTDAAAAVAHPDFLRRPEDISLLLQAKKTPSSEAIHESEQAFDPLHSWGNPQGMPAPNPPHTRLSTPRTRTSTIPAKTGHSTATATPHAPETLPPGPPVYLDVIWVPGYIVRAPFDVAVTFFTQVRARCYILSGDSLHPLVGEAMIAGISKWTAEEKAHVGSMGHAGLQGINVIPTDEPLDWVRWLRTNCGSTTVSETGEQRLQAAGIQVHPSATLCDIHFSDKGTEVTCQGTQISI